MTTPKNLWVLLGDRSGNNSQSLGVAEALNIPFTVKNLDFTPLARLPNFLFYQSGLGIKKSSLQALTPPWPDMVIGAGRKLGRAALYIKAKNPDCLLVHIQSPGFPTQPFNLIASPLHDGIVAGKNIMTTIGSPHRVTLTLLEKEANTWRAVLSHLPAPKIALLVGGSAHYRHMTGEQMIELAQLSSQMATKWGGSLLITTSRRTDPTMITILKENLSCPYYLHAWKSGGKENPYYGFLGLADAIIVTGDSVTMGSEACSTGKAVFIYSRNNFTSTKHRSFHQALYERHLAKPLQAMDNAIFIPPYRLDDTAAVVAKIHEMLATT